MQNYPGVPNGVPGPQVGGNERIGGLLDRIASNGAESVAQLGRLMTILSERLPFSAAGSFAMTAATSLVILNPNVQANSHISLMETNASAGTLQAGANRLYISARTAGVSFTVATAGGGAAAGTELFGYLIATPGGA